MDNFLLFTNGPVPILKLTDFGFAQMFQENS